jgi:hypothetical protein
MTTQSLVQHPHDGILRWALQADLVGTGLAGLACLAAAGPLAAFTGFTPPVVFVLGLIMAGYAAFLWRLTTLDPIPARLVAVPIVGNLAWAALSWAVLLMDLAPLTVAGWWLVAVQADAVLAFAIAQYVGVRRRPRQ